MRWLLTLVIALGGVACETPGPRSHVPEPDAAETASPPPDVEGAADTSAMSDDMVDTADLDDTRAPTPPDTSSPSDTAEPGVSCAFEPGRILGRVCDRGGQPLHDARIWIDTTDCHGRLVVEAHTDLAGAYELVGVPPGEHTIRVTVEGWTGTSFTTTVPAGATVDLRSAAAHYCLDSRPVDLAVFTGQLDPVEDVLDGLGVPYDLWRGDSALDQPDAGDARQLLADRDRLLEYDLIVFGAGHWDAWFADPDDPAFLAVVETLRAFVASGGTVLTTGNAVHWIEHIAPDAIALYGDPGAGGQPGDWGDAHVGGFMLHDPVQVQSPRLGERLGFEHFGALLFPGWPVMLSAGAGTEVVLRAPRAPIVTPHAQAELADLPVAVRHCATSTSGCLYAFAFPMRYQPTLTMESLLIWSLYEL